MEITEYLMHLKEKDAKRGKKKLKKKMKTPRLLMKLLIK